MITWLKRVIARVVEMAEAKVRRRRTPNQRVSMTPVGIKRKIEDHLEKDLCERDKQARVEEFI